MSDYFPTDLLIEVLLNLPVKSLIRFTSVCKSWQSLITSPTFISSHLSNHESHALLGHYDEHDKRERYSLLKVTENGPLGINSSSELEFPFKSVIGYFRIVGSCGGLVCLYHDFFVNPSEPVIIWNPSARNHVVLPKAIIDPEKPNVIVLGFGVASRVYKVVRLVYCIEHSYSAPPQAEVFSLGTGRWRKVKGSDVRLEILEYTCQVFLKGVVHWLAYHEPITDDGCRSSILTFHVGGEVFGEVMFPDELASYFVTGLCIFMIGESLGAILYDKEAGNLLCDVWVMKDYGVKESWTKLYRINLVEGFEKVVAFWKSGEVLLALKGHELVAYNPETRRTKNLGIYGTPRSFYIDNYAESLLLFKGHNGAAEEELSGGGALEGSSLDAWSYIEDLCCFIENRKLQHFKIRKRKINW